MALLLRSYGRGLLPAVVLGVVAVLWTPAAGDRPALADADGDGVIGAADRCPARAGLPPDGCPPQDSDGDQVLDRVDECPEHAGPPANRGCPDRDTDGDGVTDRLDRCPTVMGAGDHQGCPPPDADDDGVPDAADRCPDRAEVWNGRKDGDGCADRGAAVVTVGQGRVRFVRAPRLDATGQRLPKAERWRVAIAARALASARANAVIVEVVSDYGRSYGDSLQRSRRLARAVAEAVADATGLAPAFVQVRALGPDGAPRVELRYR